MNEIVWDDVSAPSGDIEWDAPKKTRGYGEELLRQGGLTLRHGIEGIASLPSMVMDPINQAMGLKPLSQGLSGVLDSIGLPKPESGAEKFAGAVSRGIAGASPVTAGAVMAKGALANVPMLRSIAANPVADLASAGVGAGASELAQQGGAGTFGQLAAGAIAPMALGAVGQGIKTAASVPRELVRPLTQGGAEQIAADTLGRLVQNREASVMNLNRFNNTPNRGVPGSRPTAAEAAGDYGLTGAQQIIARGDNNPLFAIRQADNNAARLTDLGRLNATERVVEQYRQKREAITAPLREQAFDNARRDVDYTPVAERIGELVSTPAGGRAESQKAFDWLAKRLDTYADQGRTDARNAYELYKDIGLLVAGKVKDANGSDMRLAGGLANEVKRALGREINEAAPGFSRYLEHYARLSRPIDRLETITQRLGGEGLDRVTNALPSVSGGSANYTLSQAKMRTAVKDITAETNLAPRQRDILNRVLGELNAETFASRGGKLPGSDTYQNMASANFVRRMLGDTLAESGLGKAVQAPFSLANKPFEGRINDIVTRAFQDPQLMEELLRKARTSRGNPTLAGLLDYSAPRVGGGLLGSLLQ